MPKQKRDNEYYRQRLKTVAPALYKRVLAGEISVTKARRLAGLGGTRTRLSELLNSWSKATAAEKRKFIEVITGRSPSPAAKPARAAFDADGLMLSWAAERIAQILERRRMSPGDMSVELGLKRLNASVGNAMRGDVRVKESTRIAVEKWLKKNAHV